MIERSYGDKPNGIPSLSYREAIVPMAMGSTPKRAFVAQKALDDLSRSLSEIERKQIDSSVEMG